MEPDDSLLACRTLFLRVWGWRPVCQIATKIPVQSAVPVPVSEVSPVHPSYADAVPDRLIHNAHRVDLKGKSQRKLRAKRTMPNTWYSNNLKLDGCTRGFLACITLQFYLVRVLEYNIPHSVFSSPRCAACSGLPVRHARVMQRDSYSK